MTQHLIKKYFRQLDNLQKIIFSCLLNRDYAEREDEYEKKFHQAKSKLLSIIPAQAECYLVEIIFSLNLLKFRIPDHATFEVCEQELRDISNSLSIVLRNPTH